MIAIGPVRLRYNTPSPIARLTNHQMRTRSHQRRRTREAFAEVVDRQHEQRAERDDRARVDDDREDLFVFRIAAEHRVEDREEHTRERGGGDRQGDPLRGGAEVRRARSTAFHPFDRLVVQLDAERFHRAHLLIEHGVLADVGREKREGRAGSDEHYQHQRTEPPRTRRDVGVGGARREQHAEQARDHVLRHRRRRLGRGLCHLSLSSCDGDTTFDSRSFDRADPARL